MGILGLTGAFNSNGSASSINVPKNGGIIGGPGTGGNVGGGL